MYCIFFPDLGICLHQLFKEGFCIRNHRTEFDHFKRFAILANPCLFKEHRIIIAFLMIFMADIEVKRNQKQTSGNPCQDIDETLNPFADPFFIDNDTDILVLSSMLSPLVMLLPLSRWESVHKKELLPSPPAKSLTVANRQIMYTFFDKQNSMPKLVKSFIFNTCPIINGLFLCVNNSVIFLP